MEFHSLALGFIFLFLHFGRFESVIVAPRVMAKQEVH